MEPAGVQETQQPGAPAQDTDLFPARQRLVAAAEPVAFHGLEQCAVAAAGSTRRLAASLAHNVCAGRQHRPAADDHLHSGTAVAGVSGAWLGLSLSARADWRILFVGWFRMDAAVPAGERSEEHTSELQSLMRISYAVFCLKKK